MTSPAFLMEKLIVIHTLLPQIHFLNFRELNLAFHWRLLGLIGFYLQMYAPHMRPQIVTLGECLVAQVAFVILDFLVGRFDVLFQVSPLVEGPAALCATVILHFSVHCFFMCP